jgi:hypothetical protein
MSCEVRWIEKGKERVRYYLDDNKAAIYFAYLERPIVIKHIQLDLFNNIYYWDELVPV